MVSIYRRSGPARARGARRTADPGGCRENGRSRARRSAEGKRSWSRRVAAVAGEKRVCRQRGSARFSAFRYRDDVTNRGATSGSSAGEEGE
ncbi:hypothetical protein GN956_G24483 [Arapaima gigas]